MKNPRPFPSEGFKTGEAGALGHFDVINGSLA